MKLHFFAANDVNGDVLHEITDESPYFKSLRIKPERDGLGSGELVLARRVGFAGFASGTFRAEAFVRLIIPAYSSTSYYPWGFFLNKRQQTVIHVQEDGGEEFHFGGPGPKQYLSRHALGIEQQTGTGANIDLENGVWRWNEHATVGRILDRIIQEDAALNNPSLPDLTYTFDNLDDSASVAWADDDIAGPGEYEIPIGTDLLKILGDLDDFVPLTSWIDLGTVASPKFELNVTQGLGDDNTGSAFGAGVCLLKEAVNIADDSLETEGASLRQASHVLVEGKDGVWVQAVRPGYSPGDYTKREKISFTRTSNEAWLEAVGKRWLTRQDNGEKELTVEIVPGANDAAGEYFPAPNRVLWLSNLISLDTSADGTSQSALDITAAEDQLVTGFEMETHGAADDSSADALAKSWTVKVKLNIERAGNVQKTPDQKTSARPGPSGCKCVQLCTDTAVTVETSTAWKVTAAGAAPAGFHEPGFDDSALAFAVANPNAGYADPTSSRWIWNDADATAGSDEHRNFRIEFEVTEAPSAAELEVSGDNGARVFLNGDLIGTVGGAEEGAHDNSPFTYASIASLSVDPALFLIGTNCLSIEGWNETDALPGPAAVYAALTYDSAELTGASARAARCDHTHHHNDLLERDAPATHPADSISYDNAGSGLTADTLQEAIDELASTTAPTTHWEPVVFDGDIVYFDGDIVMHEVAN